MLARLLPSSALLFVLLAAFLGGSEGTQFRVCEDAKQRQVAGPGVNQVQMVYNANRHEYFAAFLFLEGEQSSIMGQRYDERGSAVGGVIPIFTWQESMRTKQSPAVAYNNVSDSYLVAWEFDWRGDNSDWDVLARVVYGNGSVIDPYFFVGYSFGRDDSPHLAFSPKDRAYVLVHEIEDPLTKTRGIVAVRLNETHTLGLPLTVNTSNTDREPFVAYHPPSNDFVVVWEWDNDKDNKSVIGAAVVGDTPLRVKNGPNVVGSTVEIIGGKATLAHDHDAQLAYSPADDHFLLVWEVDGDSGEKEVVCSRVTPDATSKTGFRVVGNSSHPYDRRPSVVYSPYTNDFLIVYESGPDPVSTQIEGVSFHSPDLSVTTAPFAVSEKLNREHAPAIAISSTCGSVLALWASDTSLPSKKTARSSASLDDTPRSRFASRHHEHGDSFDTITSVYVPRNKFGGEERSNGFAHQDAVPHLYGRKEIAIPHREQSASKRDASDMSNLELVQLCLPGRGSCSAAGTPLPPVPKPKPDDKNDDNGSPAMGIVLGLLGAVVGLAGLGVACFFVWKKSPQIREWIEARRAGGFEGVWAEESEFSISVDAFTGRATRRDLRRSTEARAASSGGGEVIPPPPASLLPHPRRGPERERELCFVFCCAFCDHTRTT